MMRKIYAFILVLVTIGWIMLKGGNTMSAIAIVYATLILKGKIEYKDVVARIKPQVKQALEDMGVPELAVD